MHGFPRASESLSVRMVTGNGMTTRSSIPPSVDVANNRKRRRTSAIQSAAAWILFFFLFLLGLVCLASDIFLSVCTVNAY
jgi:hypothetical protein